MSEFNQMVELTQKMFYYLDTFEVNNGRKLAKEIIWEQLRKDAVEEKMRQLRASSIYEESARKYYAKNSTVGEF